MPRVASEPLGGAKVVPLRFQVWVVPVASRRLTALSEVRSPL